MIENVVNKLRRPALCMALFFIPLTHFTQAYFQQQVNYKMQVRLSDSRHSLHAFTEITYINHAPRALDTLWFHLWPNAYRNNQTALGKQLLQLGKTDFYFSLPEEKGFIDSLNFKAGDEKIKWGYHPVYSDICFLVLNKPLPPEDSLKITTPFYVKIPDAKFSRLGHSEQAYYITQWYPKPAVYDRNGWHAMPYLDQGEFYSEFGTFDVSITLPQNYFLAATGNRVNNAQEEDFMAQRIKESTRKKQTYFPFGLTEEAPPSSSQYKTVRFVQQNVHDFAWFADKRFYILQGQVELPQSKRKVNTWAFFTSKNFNTWKNAIDYINQSVLFYSKQLGEYPYDHVTAVDGTIMAGGGMEYPNITVIGETGTPYYLDVVIAHEVGHNWLYGILGNNERKYPFLDEGLNSYYEMMYTAQRYPNYKLTNYLNLDSTFTFLGLHKLPVWKDKELAYVHAARRNTDQAINLSAEEFTEDNYGAVVYDKSALALAYLRHYLGAEKFDAGMKNYFQKFMFRHPEPTDFFNTVAESAETDTASFNKIIADLFKSKRQTDYKLCKSRLDKNGKRLVTIKNKGTATLPFTISAIDKSGSASVTWMKGFSGKQTFTLNSDNAVRLKIDAYGLMPDVDRRNNNLKTNGIFKRERPLRFNFLFRMEDETRRYVNYVPVFMGNYYNGLLTGIAFHNYGVYTKRFEYVLAPMYGFRTNTPAGQGQFEFNLFPEKFIQQIIIGSEFRSYSYDVFKTTALNRINGTSFRNLYFSYQKISPYLDFEIRKKKAVSTFEQHVTIKGNLLFTDSLNTSFNVIKDIGSRGPVKKKTFSYVNVLSYTLINHRVLNPFTVDFTTQQAGNMVKTFATLQYSISTSKKSEFVIRAFAGTFLSGSAAERAYYAFRPSGYSGPHDYLLEGHFVARNENSGLGPAQFLERDGNMKTWTLLAGSPDWMAALNLRSPRIFLLPMYIYADLMVCDGRVLPEEKLLWDSGLGFTFFKNALNIYVPLGYSQYIQKIYALNGVDFFRGIRFSINIPKFAPREMINNAF